MQSLFNQVGQVIGIALLHSLWQGLLIYALLRITLLCFPSASSSKKYNLALLALAASVLWPAITLVIEIGKHPLITPTGNIDTAPFEYIPITHAYQKEVLNTWSVAIDNYLPYIVVFWFIGIVLNSARLLWGWRNVFMIKQSVMRAPVLSNDVEVISRMLGLTKKVNVFFSQHIDVPCIVGCIRPMIILPIGIMSQFSAEQIRSILIHEMAHIRRNDYFINIIQQIIGILFFFNPFTYLINKIIYNEREHCCDDLVLQTTGKPLVYAQTLLLLEEARSSGHQLILAATGKKHYLLNRIKRIMETKKQVSNIRHIAAAVLLLLGSMGTIAWLNPEIKDGKVFITPLKQIPFTMPFDGDTTKKASVKPNKTRHTGSRTIPGKVAFPKPKSANAASKGYAYFGDNPTLNKLSAEVQKQSEALSKYFNSPEYKAIEKQMEEKGHTLDSLYNRPELKKLQDEMNAKSEALNKLSESPEMKELQQKMEKLGNEQSQYFESAEYKKLQKNFEEQGKWFEKENASKSPEFKKRSEDLEKAGQALRAYTQNPQYKADMDQMRVYSNQMREVYNRAEYKQLSEEMRTLGKQMHEAYKNPEIKQQQEQLRALSKKMKEYTNSPAIKRQKELLNQASVRLREYTNSPAFKKLREEMAKNIGAMYYSHKDQVDTVYKHGK